MTTPVPVVLVVAGGVQYGSLHRQGCRRVSVEDADLIGNFATLKEAIQAALDYTGWEDEDSIPPIKCAGLAQLPES